MAWVSGVLKGANGAILSPDCLASDVYLDDGRTVTAALATLDIQAAALSASVSNLTTAAANLAAATNGESD